MYKPIYIVVLFFIFNTVLYSQAPVPASNRLVNWKNVGNLPNNTIGADNVFDVTDYGAIPDNGLDDFAACSLAINDAKNAGGVSIIYFPEGIFNINQTIELLFGEPIGFEGNIIFQGEGSDKTFLYFNLPGNAYPCFNFEGLRGGHLLMQIKTFKKELDLLALPALTAM